MNDVFGKRLRNLRKDHGETQIEVAKLLNVQRTTIGEYERGNIRPPMDKLKVLADHYDVSVDYLIGSTEYYIADIAPEAPVTDISKTMRKLLSDLENTRRMLTFDGKYIDDELRELLASSISHDLRLGELVQNARK